ncbi:MAG: flagellar basal body P-ring formation chaperone FlgA [Hyphomicrobiales bacterium]|nr:flagellar basal body P-ring formation chaperone FlgA [Hyphomicrobiales bacterium]
MRASRPTPRGLGLALFAALFAAPSAAEPLTVPVPRETIYPGDVITQDMIAMRGFQRRSVQEKLVALDAAAVVGSAARRTLVAGLPIPLASLGKPHLVKQGQTAVIMFEYGGLRITATVVALEAGAAGDAIKVRNSDTSAVITAVIQADGRLRAP